MGIKSVLRGRVGNGALRRRLDRAVSYFEKAKKCSEIGDEEEANELFGMATDELSYVLAHSAKRRGLWLRRMNLQGLLQNQKNARNGTEDEEEEVILLMETVWRQLGI
ncbi:hypothetical protein M1373_03755 [Candidatus Marsarchaeota archaeon]|nr:hypothetical protein [Candidatus Marsarchaeota archaeon]MCL5405035.1 hypothetical protein [Candidatus Marsarchaeota archaeon]